MLDGVGVSWRCYCVMGVVDCVPYYILDGFAKAFDRFQADIIAFRVDLIAHYESFPETLKAQYTFRNCVIGAYISFARRSAFLLVIITKPSSNSTRHEFILPRAVTLHRWPFRPQRFHR